MSGWYAVRPLDVGPYERLRLGLEMIFDTPYQKPIPLNS